MNLSRRILLLLAIAVGGVGALSSPAGACPFCNSATGEEVRSGIFNADFVRNVVATLWPFPVLLGIVGAIYLGPPPWYVRVRRQKNRTASEDEGEELAQRPG